MTLRLSGSRLLSALVFSVLFGSWMAGDDVTRLAELRALPHDALLAKLAERYDGGYATNIFGAFFVVLIVYGSVESLTRLFDWVAALLGWRKPPAAANDVDGASAGSTPFV